MSYNAVLRNENAEVVGRVLLSNLTTLPTNWEVMYGEDFIPLSTDLKTLLCDSKVPLSVYTVPVERQIIVKSEYGAKFELSVDRNVNVSTLKSMIEQKMEGTDGVFKFYGYRMNLYLDDEHLSSHQTVTQFVLQRKCAIIHMERKRHVLLTKSQRKAAHRHNEAVPVSHKWKRYSYGLNINGTCPTESCTSHKIPLKQTSHPASYGFLRIDLNKQTFHCPACGGSFSPANFVVCDAGALFRYKKSKGCHEIQSTVLESFGRKDEYASFNVKGEEYDWIEVKTVKKNESFHVCGRCDMSIRMEVDAVLYECGHPVHLACKQDQCGICNARLIPDVEFTALAGGPSLIISGKRKRTSAKLYKV